MLLNYFKLAIRLLLRNPFFTFINIFGLSLGFAAFIVLWQYTTNELSTDQFHDDFKNKARLAFSWTTRDNRGNASEAHIGPFSPSFPAELASEHEEFANFTRLYQQPHFTFADVEDHGKEIFLSVVNDSGQPLAFKESNLAYADPNFFEFFSISLVHGNPETVLNDPASIVLSESMAKRYFPEGDIENKTLLLNNSIGLKVTGVFKDLPHNTHLRFDALMSTARIVRQLDNFASEGGVVTYFHIKSGQDLVSLGEKLDASAKKFLAPSLTKLNLNPDDIKFYLQPVEQIAFSKFRGDLHQTRSRTLLVVLRIASVAILITAWINYLNLVICANSKRTKELGVRRTSGAGSCDFIIQFTLESVIINALSVVGAITLVQITRLPLQEFFQVFLSSGGGVSVNTVVIMVLITFSGIVITGAYPALAVKNKSTRNIFTQGYRHTFYLGKWLTAFQFSVAIIMMISVSAIQSQLSYVLNRDLGLRRDEVVVIDLPENSSTYTQSSLDVFLNRLSTFSGITDFAVSSSVPGDNFANGVGLQLTAGSEFVGTDTNGGIDERFLPFFNITLLAGRNFVNNDPSNEHSVIVSRNVLRRLGIDNPKDAIGLTILVESKAWTHDMAPVEIIGVIEDYYRKPLIQASSGWANEDGVSLTYHNNVDAENTPQKVSVLIDHETFSETLQWIQTVYQEIFSNSTFHWYFLDDNVNRHYHQERISRNQIMLFSALVVVIACLGLLGMISNKAEEKTKEIGIRKVLGAKMHQIARLLLATTINQIAIAAAIGIPVAHLLVRGYMEKFSDRVPIEVWHYATPVLVLLIILLLTVTDTLRKAVNANPVDSLRYE